MEYMEHFDTSSPAEALMAKCSMYKKYKKQIFGYGRLSDNHIRDVDFLDEMEIVMQTLPGYGLKRAEFHQNVQPLLVKKVVRRNSEPKTIETEQEEKERELSSSWEMTKPKKLPELQAISSLPSLNDLITANVEINTGRSKNKIKQTWDEKSSEREYEVILNTIKSLTYQIERIVEKIDVQFLNETVKVLTNILSLAKCTILTEFAQTNCNIAKAIDEMTESVFSSSKWLAITCCISDIRREVVLDPKRKYAHFPLLSIKGTFERTVDSMVKSFTEVIKDQLNTTYVRSIRLVDGEINHIRKKIERDVKASRLYVVFSVEKYWKHRSKEPFRSGSSMKQRLDETLDMIETYLMMMLDNIENSMKKAVGLFSPESNTSFNCTKLDSDCNQVFMLFNTLARLSAFNFELDIINTVLEVSHTLGLESKSRPEKLGPESKSRPEKLSVGPESKSRPEKLSVGPESKSRPEKLSVGPESKSRPEKHSEVAKGKLVNGVPQDNSNSECIVGKDPLSLKLAPLVDELVRETMYDLCKHGHSCRQAVNKVVKYASAEIDDDVKNGLSDFKAEIQQTKEEFKCSTKSVFEKLKIILKNEVTKY